MLAITGLRIAKISLLPVDWQQTLDYLDRDGMPPGNHGGFFRALLLRHFAENEAAADETSGHFGKHTNSYLQCLSRFLMRPFKKKSDYQRPFAIR